MASIVSVLHIVSHFRIYTRPSQQRLIVRISAVIPIYAISSALSLSCPEQVLYFAAVRDIAEAFVIYSFLTLLYDYLGGEGAIVNAINGMPIKGGWTTWTCCLTGMPFSLQILRFCKRVTLQVNTTNVYISFTCVEKNARLFKPGFRIGPSCGFFSHPISSCEIIS